MSTDASAVPRFGLPLALPRLRALAEWRSTQDPASWPAPPQGEGRPVMLIPGFLAGDASLTRMALWLRSGGFELARSGIVWNTNCLEPTVAAVEQRLERAVDRVGHPALLIGQSRGGMIARVLAVRRPDLVDTLVALGSPILDPLAVTRRVWPSLAAVGLLGTLGVPGMFSISCTRGDCCRQARSDALAPFPDDVRFLSFYSRSDEVVRWPACLDPAAVQIEVHTSHLGMGMADTVWVALSSRLTA